MRVVAMSLKVEIIGIIQEDKQSDGSSFPSTSTYLQSKSSWCPSLNSQGLRVRMSHIWPITHLFLTERLFGHKAPWASYQCHGRLWDCPFLKECNSTPWGTQFSLSWWISDSMCSTSDSSAFSVTASQLYPVQNRFWRERSHSKHPKQSTMDTEIKARLRKNTLWAAISIGRVFSA